VLTREECTRRPGTTPAVEVLVSFTDGSGTAEENGTGVCGQSVGRRLGISIGNHAIVFGAALYGILACGVWYISLWYMGY
jgi:hypothetical protein